MRRLQCRRDTFGDHRLKTKQARRSGLCTSRTDTALPELPLARGMVLRAHQNSTKCDAPCVLQACGDALHREIHRETARSSSQRPLPLTGWLGFQPRHERNTLEADRRRPWSARCSRWNSRRSAARCQSRLARRSLLSLRIAGRATAPYPPQSHLSYIFDRCIHPIVQPLEEGGQTMCRLTRPCHKRRLGTVRRADCCCHIIDHATFEWAGNDQQRLTAAAMFA